jgi:hypothetical protein
MTFGDALEGIIWEACIHLDRLILRWSREDLPRCLTIVVSQDNKLPSIPPLRNEDAHGKLRYRYEIMQSGTTQP